MNESHSLVSTPKSALNLMWITLRVKSVIKSGQKERCLAAWTCVWVEWPKCMSNWNHMQAEISCALWKDEQPRQCPLREPGMWNEREIWIVGRTKHQNFSRGSLKSSSRNHSHLRHLRFLHLQEVLGYWPLLSSQHLATEVSCWNVLTYLFSNSV